MSVEYVVSVQCRFGSSRLPGKAMYPVAGVPLLPFLLRRLKAGLADEPCRIVLCTTTAPGDDLTAVWGEREGIAVFRGPKDDVLSRHLQVLAASPAMALVRVTADNPLTCPGLVAAVAERVSRGGADYADCAGFPYGAGADAFSAATLKTLGEVADDPADREHINKYILDNPDDFSTVLVEAEGSLNRPDLRVTVDTLEDWRRMARLLEKAGRTRSAPVWEVPLDAAVAVMD